MRCVPICLTMYTAKLLGFLIVTSIFTISLYSYMQTSTFPLFKTNDLGSQKTFAYAVTEKQQLYDSDLKEQEKEYILDTVGCKIPNMMSSMAGAFTYKLTAQVTCGERQVDLHRINETHVQLVPREEFVKAMRTCTYQFVKRSTKKGKEDQEIVFTPEITFKKNSSFLLDHDFIKVKCIPYKQKNKKDIYTDAVTAVKKRKRSNSSSVKPWNILVIGVDTMSRIRTVETVKRTLGYFHQNDWIDFNGYHKIGDNTHPNLVAALTGRYRQTLYKCANTKTQCNDLFIWSKFKKHGYVTAYGEDMVTTPDTYSYIGFKQPPTDHYMRPLFLTESSTRSFGKKHQIFCTGKKLQSSHILDYAADFAQTYKTDNFFGFFWTNFFHNPLNSHPESLDEKLANFFMGLNKTGILSNTFVIFMSDHGMRYGELRKAMSSYYTERLPMFFMWVPHSFREKYSMGYNNLIKNRLRLVTPYDLYLTFEDILQTMTCSDTPISLDVCPKCQSLLSAVPSERTCSDAAIEPKWCSCHDMKPLNNTDEEGIASVNYILRQIHNVTERIETAKCTKCALVNVSSITRMHYYFENGLKMFVVAFVVSPGNMGYEATVSWDGKKYDQVGIVSTISPLFGHTYCVKTRHLYLYCYCQKQKC